MIPYKLQNGAICVMERIGKDGDKIVLAQMEYNAQKFVTWVKAASDGSTYWGHYFTELDKALEDFNAR